MHYFVRADADWTVNIIATDEEKKDSNRFEYLKSMQFTYDAFSYECSVLCAREDKHSLSIAILNWLLPYLSAYKPAFTTTSPSHQAKEERLRSAAPLSASLVNA